MMNFCVSAGSRFDYRSIIRTEMSDMRASDRRYLLMHRDGMFVTNCR